jgi:hypothetical protein
MPWSQYPKENEKMEVITFVLVLATLGMAWVIVALVAVLFAQRLTSQD